MKMLFKWLVVFAGIAVVSGFLVWSYHRHRDVPEHEEEAAAGEEKKEEEAGHTVKLNAETQQRVGLAFAQPSATELAREVSAFGQVVDPSPLAALAAELATAEAALATSRATAQRESGLFAQQQNISRKVLDASEAQFRADEARARAVRRRLQLEWGESFSQLESAERETLLDALARGTSAMVRVDVPAGEPVEELPVGASVYLLSHEDEPVAVRSVWAAAAVDPKTQAQGFLLLVDHPPHVMRPGAAAVAHLALAGEKQKGVLIARAAVVRHEGKGWAYVKKGAEDFERREVPLDHATEQGWFATDGFTTQDELVVTGTQSLLSEELKGQMAEE